jgi:hypothetical protein
MEHYVTLFDSLFLPQGLALHLSMERQAGEYTLWVLCMEDDVFATLSTLKLPHVNLLQLSKLETQELLEVKKGRTKGEYCWTLTPFAPRFVFEADQSVARVTYIDADMWFRKNPLPIFKEFDASGKQVLITDHAYAPEYDQSATSGQYCVQFMTFTRVGGEVVRKWWEERCLEWCYSRYEDGKFGDQKYLDDWPERFAEYVHVLGNKELLLAPWNATRFPYGNSCVWHFHSLRLVIEGKGFGLYYGGFQPTKTQQTVYAPYREDMRLVVDLLSQHGIKVKPQSELPPFYKLQKMLRGFYHQLRPVDQSFSLEL